MIPYKLLVRHAKCKQANIAFMVLLQVMTEYDLEYRNKLMGLRDRIPT